MSDELKEIRMKKMEQIKKQYLNGEKNMEKNLPSEPITINDADFNSVIKKHNTIVIDCWAAWCGPCRMMTPVIDELAKEFKGKIVFGKLNVDENPKTSMNFKIMSIPTLLVFKNGSLVDRIIGAYPKEELKKKLIAYV
jgi:thioredoxin 1